MSSKQIIIENIPCTYDDKIPLGDPGGFGEVFLGELDGQQVAVKRLKTNAAGFEQRELNIAEKLRNRKLMHVVPVYLAGKAHHDDRYYIVMPRCSMSLREVLKKGNAQFDEKLTRDVILAVLNGLEEINDITHRDIKPDNILQHDGIWKLADFGISKALAEATSVMTLRSALTPAYAAPEQWQNKRALQATDIYALGCICHELISGAPPFSGVRDELEQRHLFEIPPPLAAVPQNIAAFINQMLRKEPTSRPTLSRCIDFFSHANFQGPLLHASNPLAAIAQSIETDAARAEVEKTAQEVKYRGRRVIYEDGLRELRVIQKKLLSSVEEVSECVRRTENLEVIFGKSVLGFSGTVSFVDDPVLATQNAELIHELKKASRWDVLAMTSIAVGYVTPDSYSFSANLILASLNSDENYRWYEISFFAPFGNRQWHEPFALTIYTADFWHAISPGMHSVQIAYGPLAIDGEEQESFGQRWLTRMAAAAKGELRAPSYLPLKD